LADRVLVFGPRQDSIAEIEKIIRGGIGFNVCGTSNQPKHTAGKKSI
jgi:hypothetical protein